jgi:uncharacterized protein involved in exopolysaccharide biosynthesis
LKNILSESDDLISDEIDFKELLEAIWKGKFFILFVTTLFCIASVIYSLSLPNIYQSDALIAPVSDKSGTAFSGQLGGLAALAGVDIGNGGTDKITLAIEIMKSREFISRFIEKHSILADLMAVEHWDSKSNTITYDSEIYDVKNDSWVRLVEHPRQAKPSLQEAFIAFEKLFSVSQDPLSGMIKISILHQSPFVSQKWVNWLISDINNEMKERDIQEAQRSIDYLQKQIPETNISDVKVAIFSLIEEQIKTLMLANVREEYVFKVVDKAIVPEEKESPRRSVIVLLITFVGCFFSIIFVLTSNVFRNKYRG